MHVTWIEQKSCGVFSHFTQQKRLIFDPDCDVRGKPDLIWQLMTIGSVIGPRPSFSAFSKAKFAPKKYYGGSLLSVLQLLESEQNHHDIEVLSVNRQNLPETGIDQQWKSNSSSLQRQTAYFNDDATNAAWVGLWNYRPFAILARFFATDYHFLINTTIF